MAVSLLAVRLFPQSARQAAKVIPVSETETYTAQKHGALFWLGLGFLLLLALGVRLPGLGEPTISHPEFYTPGIVFPDYVMNPFPRVEFLDVIRSVYAPSDIHPPGFHLLIWGWTKLFGTSHLAIRLPSAMIGTATVLMLFLLGVRTKVPWAGFGAGCLLALHTLHINKSIQSEIWIWPGFYALATVLLMLAYLDKPGTKRWFAYVLVLAMGLWTEYSFWVFAACQIAFVMLQAPWRPRLRPLLEGQAFALLLSLPVLIHLRNDLLNGARAYLDMGHLDFILDVLRFGRLVDTSLANQLTGGGTASSALLLGLSLLGGLLLLFGIRAEPRDAVVDGPEAWAVPPYVALGIAGTASALVALYAAVLPLGWKVPTLLVVFSWVVALSLHPLLGRFYPLCSGIADIRRRMPRFIRVFDDPVAWHAVLPVIGYLIIGAITNILVPRLMLIVIPLLLLTMAKGLGHLVRITPKAIPATLGAAVLAFSVASATAERSRFHSAREYQAVARGLETRMKPGDLIVACYAWYTAPLNYYLTQDRFDFIRAVDLPKWLSSPVRRVWVVVYGESPEAEFAAFEKILTGFSRFDRFTAREVTVRGYQRSAGRVPAGNRRSGSAAQSDPHQPAAGEKNLQPTSPCPIL